jgi:hypothetical protein
MVFGGLQMSLFIEWIVLVKQRLRSLIMDPKLPIPLMMAMSPLVRITKGSQIRGYVVLNPVGLVCLISILKDSFLRIPSRLRIVMGGALYQAYATMIILHVLLMADVVHRGLHLTKYYKIISS